MDILIVTYNRINTQITYQSLPLKWQKKVIFVIRPIEVELFKQKYPENKLLILSESLPKGLGPTRQFVYDYYHKQKMKVITFDDDLNFIYKYYIEENDKIKWKSRPFTDQDFDNMFEDIEKELDTTFHGSLGCMSTMPNQKSYPKDYCGRGMTNLFYNTAKLPADIDFTRCSAAEDFDSTLQLLTKGFKNVIYGNYKVTEKAYAAGGCTSTRTVETHNESQKLLQTLFPNYVKVKEKVVKSGPWKGQTKLNVLIQWKKAYKDSLKKLTINKTQQ